MFNFNTKKTDVQIIIFQAQRVLPKLGVDRQIKDFPLQNEEELLKDILDFDSDPQLWEHLLSLKINILYIGLFCIKIEHWIST